jgi:diguanylate cyclase (GGDEF)-like protein
MKRFRNDAPYSQAERQRAEECFRAEFDHLAARVDRMMSRLLLAEWAGMMVLAGVITPRTWNGTSHSVNPHMWAAILAGPAFILPTILISRLYPARQITRHVIAVAQMLASIVLIDVTGGRIETHFHIFGSLAFLAFYRDWRVLVTASVVTALDHLVRGIWWPQSVYGVLTVSPWRWVEHTWWVAFEDFFLILASRRSIEDMWAVARHEAKLYWGAYHDVLTGLPNRRMLEECFGRAQNDPEARRAIVFLDLDRFKQANDTLGHTIGDKLLALVAERLAAVLTKEQTLARIGGDEFVALLDEVGTPEKATDTAGRLLAAMAAAFRIDGHELLLSASVGISLYPDHGRDLAMLQERADNAMYVAKSLGRNQCVVFSREMARREQIVQEISRDLYMALPERQFRLHFQPLVGRSTEVVGFEALLRWIHPVHGLIPPSEFIPIAEKSGLIVGIGEWVLREASRHCAEWQIDGGRPIGVAVNVSGLQFERPDFGDRVRSILQECGLAPSLLTLEVTEGVLIRDVARACHHLNRLRRMGVRIALDDFGTGYSSLSYLAALPADTIKLDRSFVNREFGNGAAIIDSVIEMAHRIGLRVVAEGVETSSQGDRLLNLNCDELQGFYFSPPVAGDLVPGFLATHRDGCQPDTRFASESAA